MKLIPSEHFDYQTNSSSQDTLDALKSAVKNEAETDKPRYAAELSDSDIKIWRIIDYRNSSLPIMKVIVEPSAENSIIRVSLNLTRQATFSYCFYLLIFTCAFFGSFFLFLKEGKLVVLGGVFAMLTLIAFVLAIMHIGFNIEIKKYKKLLHDLFEPEHISLSPCTAR